MVYYELFSIDAILSTGYKEQQVFNEAIKEIEKVSCVRFVKRTTERDYVRIISSREGYENCFSVFTDLSSVHECIH